MDNSHRAKTFGKALESYGSGNPQEALIDLLTDARHWSDANGEDFYIALDASYDHYIHELNDQQQDERKLKP